MLVPLQYDRQRDTNTKTRRSTVAAQCTRYCKLSGGNQNTAFCVQEWGNENNLNIIISSSWIESTTIDITVFLIHHNASPEK